MIVKLHVPAATGVTENAAPPVLAIVAMPLQVVVEAVKVPVKFVWLAVKLCAFVAPAAVNDRLVGASATAPGAGVGVGDAVADAVGVGDGVGVGGLGGTAYGGVHATIALNAANTVSSIRRCIVTP